MALGDSWKIAGAYNGTLDNGNKALMMGGRCRVFLSQRMLNQIYLVTVDVTAIEPPLLIMLLHIC